MSDLAEPDFIERDADAIVAEMIAKFEAETGRLLQPAQIERLLVNLYAYQETLLRTSVQEAAKQNLVAYATAPMLDYLGQLVGVTRLAAAKAVAKASFVLTEIQSVDVTVPAGTRLRTEDGNQSFVTDLALTVPAGAASGSVVVTAESAGSSANGYSAGSLLTPLALLPNITKVSLSVASSGGTDVEDDERLRGRIMAASNTFSGAGPIGAYKARVLEAHADIIDCAVLSPNPGEIRIYVLAADGPAAQTILDAVSSHLSDETVRPLGDQVSVLAPVTVDFGVSATITPTTTANILTLEAEINAALMALTDNWASMLGADIVPSRLSAAISALSGVYDVAITSPAATIAVAAGEVARLTGITLAIAEAVDG